MIWCSPWQLASEVSAGGGLGLIGAGSMYPEILREHVQKCKAATKAPFGVNLPLLYPDIEAHIDTILEEEVPIVFTSAGNPQTHTKRLKEAGITVVHVISSARFAKKAEDAGVDAVVAEGFEAGGHNGREETTTLCLVPEVLEAVSVPVIAAGGIATGKAMLSMMALGADGVQIGSRFVASKESSAHPNFKDRVVGAVEGDTKLTLKEITPVRMMKNDFFQAVEDAYHSGASIDDLKALLGRGRAKKGMFEGDMNQGELEIGQVSAQIDEVLPAKQILENILAEFREAKSQLSLDNFNF